MGRRKHRHHEPDHADQRGVENRQLERLQHAVVFPRAVVVADDRLSPLIQSENRHGDKHRDSMYDAHDRDRQITTVEAELIAEDGVHHARRHLHGEHGGAGSHDRSTGPPPQSQMSHVKLEQALAL